MLDTILRPLKLTLVSSICGILHIIKLTVHLRFHFTYLPILVSVEDSIPSSWSLPRQEIITSVVESKYQRLLVLICMYF